MSRPEIVVLCGSARFQQTFRQVDWDETMAGRIVLSAGFPPGSPDAAVGTKEAPIRITPEQKAVLDEVHRRKIDLADRILVLNVGGYIGESTKSEVRYAQLREKPIDWLEPERAPSRCTGSA